MPSEKTHSDSLRLFLTGAASDGGAQASGDAALGNYRSSTEVQVLGVVETSPISGITVNYVAAANGTGDGTLTATGTSELAWTPPGGSQGTAVTIANGETKILEGGGASGALLYIRVTRTSASDLTGTATLTLSDVVNNVIGFDNVSSDEATAGDNEYRCICIKNESSNQVSNIKVFRKELGTSQTSNSGQLGASGAGTIVTAGSFSDWPASGWCQIKTSGGSTREIVYYSSRTTTTLTVPSGGRAQMGTSAAAGSSTDTVHAVPGIRLAKEAPTGSATTGNAQTIANESTAPSGVTWNTGITADTGVSIGNLGAGEIQFLWIHRPVVAGAAALANVLHHFRVNFDAA